MEEDIKQALACLRSGGIILYPTDTIWGIGCDATNAKAVERVFDLKKRAGSKSVIVLVDSEAAMERVADDVPEVAWQLVEVAARPLTLVLPRGRGVAPGVLGPDGTIAVRIPDDDFCRELCRRFRRPVVSTSANVSGTPAAGCFADIAPEIIEGVDYVVGHRRDDDCRGRASDIIKVGDGGLVEIIR